MMIEGRHETTLVHSVRDRVRVLVGPWDPRNVGVAGVTISDALGAKRGQQEDKNGQRDARG